MLKIWVGCAIACVISTSATWSLAAELVSQKVTIASLQKVKFTTQKSAFSQTERVSTFARNKTLQTNNNLKTMPENAQIGLLLTALLYFVVRSSRKKV